ncbi:unnamed protein product [Porites evermanni]|uniref:Uncharacterized protein n=1 Tax=Porites evermanni TaxID=104178 RepID=A0ABN8LXQ3_9CNID|nr:unnamed protein product [Porites evermanni]
MGGWAYQMTKPPVCTNFNPFNHLKIKSGRSKKMPNVTKVVRNRRMEKLLMGYQLKVVTPFHYILVEQTNFVFLFVSVKGNNRLHITGQHTTETRYSSHPSLVVSFDSSAKWIIFITIKERQRKKEAVLTAFELKI